MFVRLFLATTVDGDVDVREVDLELDQDDAEGVSWCPECGRWWCLDRDGEPVAFVPQAVCLPCHYDLSRR